ncbi:MAG: hypothetical protein QW228_05370 [Candidatus Aenigmatarchaeota archaeon]
MSEGWSRYEPEQLKILIQQGRFKIVFIVTEDLTVYKYEVENKKEILHLGSFGFSLDPNDNKILYWIKDNDGSYFYKEMQNRELFIPYPHHELFGRKADEKLGEVIKKWL